MKSWLHLPVREDNPLYAGTLVSADGTTAALVLTLRPISDQAGDAVCVVVDGELRVSIDTGDETLELTRCSRGDVIGEVALHQGKRTADVDALTPVRCLRVTKESLQRLGRRYSRIGTRVFWNLSEVLASRVDRLTEHISTAPRSG